MSRDPTKTTDPDDAEIEREVRRHRRYSLAEAIGRAGGELLKGASPVPRKRQAELRVKRYLDERLADEEGALRAVLARRVAESDELLADYERSLEALAAVVEPIVSSEARLRSLVQEVDAEWGRMYAERPRFDAPGREPAADDPYTAESVREALAELLATLR